MSIKELAFSTQQYLHAQTGTSPKRSHTYELLATAFGFKSYASLSANHVFTQGSFSSRKPERYEELVGRRCLDLGYPPAVALQVSKSLPAHLNEQRIGIIAVADLVAHLMYESGALEHHALDEEDDFEDGDDFHDDESNMPDPWFDREDTAAPMLLEGLTALADKGHAQAHYALALFHDPASPYDDLQDSSEPGLAGEYWYNLESQGRVLAGVEKEWADQYAKRLTLASKHEHHLRAAAALGHDMALLELAERWGEPALFEQTAPASSRIDPVRAADAAEQLGRWQEAWRWLTVAAKRGNIEVMRELIEGYDQADLQQCWTWFYLAQMLGTDLSKDDFYAIHEDGSLYDDDVGGPLYVSGQEGIKLDPMDAAQDAAARRSAAEMYQVIQDSRRA